MLYICIRNSNNSKQIILKMFTENTLLAISILKAMQKDYILKDIPQSHATIEILHRLAMSGIITCTNNEEPNLIQSYKLNYNISDITMTQLLISIHEGITIVPQKDEENKIYNKYGIHHQHLGILNQMIRTMLNDIDIRYV